ncbi:MAG: hypothetical protein HQK53_18720, partial [Oligoflexia bacterium]|nr:hypothetical protein [Oligoflexia bacterium]
MIFLHPTFLRSKREDTILTPLSEIDAAKKQETKTELQDWSQLSVEEIELFQQQQGITLRSKTLDDLQRIKLLLINGNISAAQYHLKSIDTNHNMIKLIKERYLAIIHFIKGEYLRTYEVL